MEVTYFLCVGVLLVVPMFVWAVLRSARESASPAFRNVLARMRPKRITGPDWLWTVATFVALSLASCLSRTY